MLKKIKDGNFNISAIMFSALILIIGVVVVIANSGDTYAYSDYVVTYYTKENSYSTSFVIFGQPQSATPPYFVTNDKPTMKGHQFVGWSKSRGGSTIDYNSGALIDEFSSDLDLYAVWNRDYSYYQIAYYDDSKLLYHDYCSDSSCGLWLEAKKAGYYLKGWSDSPSDNIVKYAGADNFNVSSDMSLYAVWGENYSITYYDGANSELFIEYAYGIHKLSDYVPTRNGYIFLGWATSSDSSTVSYTSGQEINVTANISLYPVYSSIDKITFYNAEGDIEIIACDLEDSKLNKNCISKISETCGKWSPEVWDKVSYPSNQEPQLLSSEFEDKTSYDTDKYYCVAGSSIHDDPDVPDNPEDPEVPDDPEDPEVPDVPDNPKTADILIYIVWSIGIGALGYSLYYFMKKKNSL